MKNQGDEIDRRNVFICHSSQDKEVVHEIVQNLEKNNISVWFDKAEIGWGESITKKINQGLRISDYVLVVLSLSFLNRSWPQRELFSALSSDISKGQSRILPLIIGSREERTRILEEVQILGDIKYLVWENNPLLIVNELNKLLFQRSQIFLCIYKKYHFFRKITT